MLFQSVFFHSQSIWITAKGECGDGTCYCFQQDLPRPSSSGGETPKQLLFNDWECRGYLCTGPLAWLRLSCNCTAVWSSFCSVLLTHPPLSWAFYPHCDLKALPVCSCSVLYPSKCFPHYSSFPCPIPSPLLLQDSNGLLNAIF